MEDKIYMHLELNSGEEFIVHSVHRDKEKAKKAFIEHVKEFDEGLLEFLHDKEEDHEVISCVADGFDHHLVFGSVED